MVCYRKEDVLAILNKESEYKYNSHDEEVLLEGISRDIRNLEEISVEEECEHISKNSNCGAKTDARVPITEFDGEYAFLSNFYECPVEYDGITYNSSEAAYQAQKCRTKEERYAFRDLTPKEAKRKGRKVDIRPDWEEKKVDVMSDIVYQKFSQNKELKEKLIATDDAELIEGNYWGDRFWGVDGTGENRLGMILMDIRKGFREI